MFALLEAERLADSRSPIIVVPEVVPADRVVLTVEQNLRNKLFAIFDRVATPSSYERCGYVWPSAGAVGKRESKRASDWLSGRGCVSGYVGK